jgi:diguanylate cyclase (GGDEF)-like protein
MPTASNESSRSQRAAWLAGCLLLIALIGWADGETGEDIGLSVFYFMPVVVGAWFSGRLGAIVLAVASACAWLACEYLWWHEHTLLGSALNGAFRLVGFALAGLATHQIRVDREEKDRLNITLAELLKHESEDARTDSLTGLANARSFNEALRTELARNQRDLRPVCLLYLDLDNFKKVNDRFGHDRGSQVLREVGSLMRRVLRSADIPARLGGDEFAALLWNTELPEARFIAERLVDAVARLDEGTGLGASVGVILFHHPGISPEDLLREVDALMYKAKHEGKSRVISAERGKPPSAADIK